MHDAQREIAKAQGDFRPPPACPVPLAQHIKHVLDERPLHRAPRVRFEQELEDYLSDAAAEETLDAVYRLGPICGDFRI